MNRVQPTEKQPSMAIFSVIDALILIIFFNRQSFEQATLKIQIWVGVLENIKIQKCYFLGLVALILEIQTGKKTGRLPERHILSVNLILVSFVA